MVIYLNNPENDKERTENESGCSGSWLLPETAGKGECAGKRERMGAHGP
jgi:hypothetical protein